MQTLEESEEIKSNCNDRRCRWFNLISEINWRRSLNLNCGSQKKENAKEEFKQSAT